MESHFCQSKSFWMVFLLKHTNATNYIHANRLIALLYVCRCPGFYQSWKSLRVWHLFVPARTVPGRFGQFWVGWGGVGWVSGWVVVWPGQFQYGTVYKHGFSRWTEVFSGSNHCVCRLQKWLLSISLFLSYSPFISFVDYPCAYHNSVTVWNILTKLYSNVYESRRRVTCKNNCSPLLTVWVTSLWLNVWLTLRAPWVGYLI